MKSPAQERVLLRIRVTPSLDEALTKAANERGVSVNWLVNNALDDFLVTNAAAINSAIPLPARTSLTTAQKARLLRWVVTYRFIKGA